jgi:hypothetical protein
MNRGHGFAAKQRDRSRKHRIPDQEHFTKVSGAATKIKGWSFWVRYKPEFLLAADECVPIGHTHR